MTDISRQTLFERCFSAIEWMVSVGRSTAVLAHDVNNPLASVLLNLQEVKMDLDEINTLQPILDSITIIERNILRSSGIVEISSLEIMRNILMKIDEEITHCIDCNSDYFAFIDINSFVESAAENIMRREGGFVISKSLNHLQKIDGDAEKLEQVFIFLFENLFETTQENCNIDVGSYQDISQAVVTFSSFGNSAFDQSINNNLDWIALFNQKDATRNKYLRLFICQKIIQGHNGTLAIAVNPNGGMMFTVCIPTCKEI